MPSLYEMGAVWECSVTGAIGGGTLGDDWSLRQAKEIRYK